MDAVILPFEPRKPTKQDNVALTIVPRKAFRDQAKQELGDRAKLKSLILYRNSPPGGVPLGNLTMKDREIAVNVLAARLLHEEAKEILLELAKKFPGEIPPEIADV